MMEIKTIPLAKEIVNTYSFENIISEYIEYSNNKQPTLYFDVLIANSFQKSMNILYQKNEEIYVSL